MTWYTDKKTNGKKLNKIEKNTQTNTKNEKKSNYTPTHMNIILNKNSYTHSTGVQTKTVAQALFTPSGMQKRIGSVLQLLRTAQGKSDS